MKQCLKCNQVKAQTEFDKERNQCKACRHEARMSRPKKVFEVSLKEKSCKCCEVVKPAESFNRDPRRPGGLTFYCNDCRSLKNKIKYTNNPEKKIQQSKKYYLENRGTEEFNAKRRVYNKNKEETSLNFKLARRLRNRLYYALKNKGWKKNTSFNEYIGCTYEELINHLESQFAEGMTWNNYGQWHIDHIKPLSLAPTPEEMYELCHFSNLKPLWGVDNIKKGNKINE